MKRETNKIQCCSGLTLLEMTIAMVIMAAIFAVLVPQLKALQNSWASRAGSTEMLQNGRVLMDHLQRSFASATQISSVSSMSETDGFIQFVNDKGETKRYDIVGTNPKYIKYGTIGQLKELAGPVSKFQITCYDACDLDTPLNPVKSPASVRLVNFEVTFPNSSAMGQDLTLNTSAFLRTGAINENTNGLTLLFVSGGQLLMDSFGEISVVPTTSEISRINLIESWGYNVSLIHEEQSQSEFNAAVADANVAYVPLTITDTYLDTKLKSAPLGIVIEKAMTQFGIAELWSPKPRDEIDIIDNSHYITSVFSTGLLTYVSSTQSVAVMIYGQAPGLITLANINDVGIKWIPSLVVMDIGSELSGGDSAAGRRVQLPWGDTTFDFTSLNNDGQTIMQRSIEWAAAVRGSSGSDGEGTYRDDFNSSSYSGNNGTLVWIGDWIEINESDGPSRGDEVVLVDPLAEPCPPTYQLRIRDNDGGTIARHLSAEAVSGRRGSPLHSR